MQLHEININRELTENQLRERIAVLEKKINAGEATVSDANRLADLQRDLKRITNVKYGRAW